MKVAVVGFGVVGKNLYAELGNAGQLPDVIDKYKEVPYARRYEEYDIAFICVDTPKTPDLLCDIREVENAMEEVRADLYIIKSTVLPGTTNSLSLDYEVIFSPEYYGGTQHCNNFDFNFTILGGDLINCQKAQQFLQHVYDARHTFRIVPAIYAELAKYMENAWLATKVTFCSAFWQICQKENIAYETLRELFILDPRVNPAHTFIYSDKPYWESHCLNKDVPAIANYYDSKFLKAVVALNDETKEGWEEE